MAHDSTRRIHTLDAALANQIAAVDMPGDTQMSALRQARCRSRSNCTSGR